MIHEVGHKHSTSHESWTQVYKLDTNTVQDVKVGHERTFVGHKWYKLDTNTVQIMKVGHKLTFVGHKC